MPGKARSGVESRATTRLRPDCLARRRRRSARAHQAGHVDGVLGQLATPQLKVSRRASCPSPGSKGSDSSRAAQRRPCVPSRRRAAAAAAPRTPRRPTRSIGSSRRSSSRSTSTTCRSARSPAWWPSSSLMRLKKSRSSSARPDGLAVARARRRGCAARGGEVAAVGQAGQAVGAGQLHQALHAVHDQRRHHGRRQQQHRALQLARRVHGAVVDRDRIGPAARTANRPEISTRTRTPPAAPANRVTRTSLRSAVAQHASG